MPETSLVLAVVAAGCALPGTFLVLRRVSLVSDAVGHVLLPGILVAYFVVKDVDSPWLLVGAAAAGMAAVLLVERLQKSGRVGGDAALGVVFPALFAAGVVLASLFTRNLHLDIDQVLLGQPEFATLPRWRAFGRAVEPAWVAAAVLAVNAGLTALFFKELKLTTFDPALAATMGFRPAVVHYGLMAATAVTAVAAFDAVGPVLVVGFFVVPAATALLLSNRLGVVLVLACLTGAAGAAAGTTVAGRLDSNTAGTVAATLGVLFGVVAVTRRTR